MPNLIQLTLGSDTEVECSPTDAEDPGLILGLDKNVSLVTLVQLSDLFSFCFRHTLIECRSLSLCLFSCATCLGSHTTSFLLLFLLNLSNVAQS